MLTACGVIAEYNPFHNGHAYQLQQARLESQADVIVVVMSGNYVQRGEPAIIDKWYRAQQALLHGADLVVELPPTQAVQPANLFAKYAIQILKQLGVTSLSFGTEVPQFAYQQVAQQLVTKLAQPDFQVDYHQTYATQWHHLLYQVTGDDSIQPNQLLALSYALANEQLQAHLKFCPIQRVGVGHDHREVMANYASASQLREWLLHDHVEQVATFIPKQSSTLPNLVTWDHYYPFLNYRLITSSPAELKAIYQMSEGLEYRLVQPQAANFQGWLQAIKTKRYTYARLRRLALYTTLSWPDAHLRDLTPYLRILGHTQRGRSFLKQQRDQFTWQRFDRISATLAQEPWLQLDLKADRMYGWISGTEQTFHHHALLVKEDRT